MTNFSAPLFPLSAHLMPGGRMRLRIFEARYVRMVKEACSNDSGFVMCMLNKTGTKADNTHIHRFGTYAKIVDFDLLEDGMLGVTVEGQDMVRIGDIQTEKDELRIGHCNTIGPWSSQVAEDDIGMIKTKLKEVFETYPEFSKLYEKPQFEDPIWVIHRWLELIPVDSDQKQLFIQQQDCQKVLTFLNELVID